MFAGTNEGLYLSKNLGDTWQLASVDIYGYPINELICIKDVLYAAGGYKIFRSTDKGVLWNDISKNFPETSPINGLSGDTNFVFIGTEDFGSWRLPVGLFYPASVSLTESSNITATSASISGKASANGYATKLFLEYSKSNKFLQSDSIPAPSNPIIGNNENFHYTIKGLNESSIYYYRIKAINSAGLVTYSEIKTFLTEQFTKIDLPVSESYLPTYANVDTITNNVSNLTTPIAGISLNQNIAGTQVKFSSRAIGEEKWFDTLLISSGKLFSLPLPIIQFNEVGLEYNFTVIPPPGFSSGIIGDTFIATRRVAKYYTKGIILPVSLKSGIKKEDYNLLSFPLDLDDKTSTSIIYPALKINQPDDTKFRFLHYVGSNGNYKEIWQSNSENVAPGIGYWFACRNLTENINSGKGKTVANSPSFDGNHFTIPLKSGYNQVGNPYLKSVSWNEITAYNKLAEIGPLISWVRHGDSVSLKRINELVPFGGGYVYNNSSHTLDLKIPVRKISRNNIRSSISPNPGLLVNLMLRNSNKSNDLATLGTYSSGDRIVEFFDLPAPTLPAKFPALTFQSQIPLIMKMIPENEIGNTWQLNASELEGVSASLSWQVQENRNNFQLFLHDLDLEVITNMHTINQYNFTGNTKFCIYAGTMQYIEKKAIPRTTSLRVFAIPGEEMATIYFSIPSNDFQESYFVQINLIDIHGRITTLHEKKYLAGFYDFTLPRQQISSGIHLIELTISDSKALFRKMYVKIFF